MPILNVAANRWFSLTFSAHPPASTSPSEPNALTAPTSALPPAQPNQDALKYSRTREYSRVHEYSRTRESLAVCLLASVCAAGAAWLGGAVQSRWAGGDARRVANVRPEELQHDLLKHVLRLARVAAALHRLLRGCIGSMRPRGWLCERRARVRVFVCVTVCVCACVC